MNNCDILLIDLFALGDHIPVRVFSGLSDHDCSLNCKLHLVRLEISFDFLLQKTVNDCF